jgi:cell division protein FtsI/penicillin-binding protein 2
LVICIGCFFILFLFRAGYEQTVNYKQNNLLWKKRLTRFIRVEGKRGKIFDSEGKLLAFDVPSYSVFADPFILKRNKKNLSLLSNILSVRRKELLSKLESDKRFVWLKRDVKSETIEKLKDLNIRGVGIIDGYERFYPGGNIASHVIGFCNIDNEGIEGIEKYYNKHLNPKCSIVEASVGMRGILSWKSDSYNTINGADVFLTIDENIQSFVQQILKKAVEENKAKKALCIVMKPGGAIVTCSNFPDFNLNFHNAYSYSRWRNRAILDVWEPGSIFKLVTMSAAIDSGKVKRNEEFLCKNMRVGKHIIHDVHRYDRLSFDDVFIKSSNVGATKIVFNMGKNFFYDYVLKFGFGERTGVDFLGEAKGLVKRISCCSDIDVANMAFGQGIAVTGIQLCSAFCVIANGGFKIKPYFVKNIVSSKGIVLYEANEKKERILKPSTARAVKEILEKVVGEGTGGKTRIPNCRMAGKTGTAQIPENGTYSKKYISSFAGFFPVEDPQFVILVSLFEPQTRPSYGGIVAAPVFKDIAQMLISYKGISENETKKTF